MSTIELHPLSAVAGGALVASVALLLGTAGGTAGPAAGFEPISLTQAEILSHMEIVYLDDGQGGVAKTIRIAGVNVQIVNDLDDTQTVNGLGNLIVGYNEFGHRSGVDDRTGSHNIVAGSGNNHLGFGGLVVGQWNMISDGYASVSGGQQNTAEGPWSSVSGGKANLASGTTSWTGGGVQNTASGEQSAVSGGRQNVAQARASSVSGGRGVEAGISYAWAACNLAPNCGTAD